MLIGLKLTGTLCVHTRLVALRVSSGCQPKAFCSPAQDPIERHRAKGAVLITDFSVDF